MARSDAYLEIRRAIEGALRPTTNEKDAYAFDSDALHRLILQLDEHIGRPSLADAVESMLVAAHELETQHGAMGPAGQLIRVVERDLVVDGMRRIYDERQAARDEAVLRSARELARLREDEQAPQRSDSDEPLKLGALDFPKRM